MLTAAIALLRTPVSTLLRRVPGMWWVILFVSLFLGASLFGAGYAYARSGMDERLAAAKATARDQIGAAAVAKRDARAEHARAERERQQSDSAAAAAAVSRAALQQLVDRAAHSRAAVDTTELPPALLAALHDADALRIRVTPTLAQDSAAIARKDATIARLEASITLDEGALAHDSLAIRALETQVAAIEHPRCTAKCGAVITAGLLELFHHWPAVVRALRRVL